MRDLSFTFAGLRAAYAGGVSPVAVIEEVYRRLDAANDPGIFLHVVPKKQALAEAAALGVLDPGASGRPLWGIPFAVKDNIDLGGAPTTAACPAFAYEAEGDAFVVGELRRAGAIAIGKTNLDQFATGLVGVRTPYPVPRNAIDPAIVPGGSSSGSAVAVARGIVAFALGTDTAGSGRVPAALNNIVGLKPSLGALSTSGVVPACRTLDTVSIFALSVEDAYEAFRVASVFDPADAYARDLPRRALGAAPSGFRVGVPTAATREFRGDAAQAASYAAALDEISALGGEIVELDFSVFYEVAALLYEGAWVAERHAVVEQLMREDPAAMLEVTRGIIGKALDLTATDAFRGFYRLRALKRVADGLIDAVDLLCVPTMPTFFSLADLAADPVGPNSMSGTYTNFVNLLDLCGLAVPVATRGDGRPGGVTLLARAGRDAALAALGSALHARAGVTLGATGWALPPARVVAAEEPGSDEIAVAVVGAHMSGLPLNGELTRLGGRFLRAAATAPAYRLHRLAGGPPARPGLTRSDDGASIALEVWALPRGAFGDFVTGIPAPLCIGTVALDDGTSVKGFLCEPAGLDGAEDITALGGWRAFLAGA